MNYHNVIWLSVGLGVVVGVLSIGVLVYTFFFENRED